jgi:hypothetical protein
MRRRSDHGESPAGVIAFVSIQIVLGHAPSLERMLAIA